jgi:hypothetical protein
MKRTSLAPIIIVVTSAFATASAAAQSTAQPGDAGECFPMCQSVVVTAAAAPAQTADPATPCGIAPTTAQSLANEAEKISERIKPVKEIIGYVRSPQGLAMKLVNDHVIAIPAWIGYALDPLGSLKHRAIDEVRNQAKSAMGVAKPVACTVAQPGELVAELEQF